MSRKIDHQLFSANEHALDQGEACPKCGEALVLRHGKHGAFLGCSQYPTCEYLRPVHNHDGHIVKELGVPCPECAHELVLRQGRFGMFIGCSNFPECHHIESHDQPQHSDQSESIGCPECKKGKLVERKSRYGKVFWSCDDYPKCKFALNYFPVSGQCTDCGFPLLVEKKYASGTKLLCADRKCSAVQSSHDD
ncbi:DNA topoisomerase family protein [Vibrio sp. RC27]